MRHPRFTATRNGVIAGVVTFLLLGAATAVLGSNPHENKPLQGTLQGASTITGVSGAVVSSTSTGTLSASHFGSGTYELVSTQDYGRHVEAQHPAGDCAFVDGTMTLTAANGDEMTGDVDADRSVICVSEEFPGPGSDAEYQSTLVVDVTGGTGRFADATGWFFSRSTSTADAPPAGTTFTDVGGLWGDIDY